MHGDVNFSTFTLIHIKNINDNFIFNNFINLNNTLQSEILFIKHTKKSKNRSANTYEFPKRLINFFLNWVLTEIKNNERYRLNLYFLTK